MPELPEVEVIRLGLLPYVLNREIVSVSCSGKRLRNEIPYQLLKERLVDSTFIKLSRRAKYLLFHTDRDDILIIHLGMTGQLGFFEPNEPLKKHDHMTIGFRSDKELRFNDTRRFGSILIYSETSMENLENSLFSHCGPEPFSPEFDGKYLHARARNKQQPVKNFIMDNRIVVGVGNIYANESLFAAGIHPLTRVNKITLADFTKLATKIQEILLWAIDCGGSTISDFLSASGNSGYFQANFKVYGKNGEPCVQCGTHLEKVVIGGRASFFCSKCQNSKC